MAQILKRMVYLWSIILVMAGEFCIVMGQNNLPAFPGAEGAGALATGGRGGEVYRVTNLNLSGAGSLADAVSQPNRIIVFTVSGIIDLSDGVPGKSKKIKVEQPNITILGQTAPGEGICLKNGSMHVYSSNVVVRYLRSRRGFIKEGDTGDAFTAKGDGSEYVIFDHLSASWATDENLTMTALNNSTAQYCIVSEGLDYTNPDQTPQNHAFGSLFGSTSEDGRVSFHHMLYAHHRRRCVRTTSADYLTILPLLDFRNSIVYDCSELTSHTGSQAVRANFINNYYKDGPSTWSQISKVMFTFKVDDDPGKGIPKLYATGNYIYGSPEKSADNWLAMAYENSNSEERSRVDTEFPVKEGEIPVTTQTALDAYETVLAEAGASLPSRDAVDLRIVRDVQNGTGNVIGKETELPADQQWQRYYSLGTPLDSDKDGIPDYWENQFGLNSEYSGDSMQDPDGDGYVNVEEYANNTDPTGGAIPIIYIGASISRAREESLEPGVFRIYRNGSLNTDLTVSYTVGGTATPGEDYDALENTVSIPAGEKSAVIFVSPKMDMYAESDEMVVVKLDTGNVEYHVGCPSQALVVIKDEAATSIGDAQIVRSMDILTNYPNPFNSSTRITFSLQHAQSISLVIFDVQGRRIVTIANGRFDAGEHHLTWAGENYMGQTVGSGIYYAVLRSADRYLVTKMMLIK